MPPRLHASTLAARRRRRHPVVVLTPTVVEEQPKVVARPGMRVAHAIEREFGIPMKAWLDDAKGGA